MQLSKEIEMVNATFENAKEYGVIKVVANNQNYDGRLLNAFGKDMVFFGNCSYLGLDQNQEMRNAAKNAIDDYGLFFASSRTFIGLELNDLVEQKLEELFGKPVNITTSTTFAHISNFQVLIGKKDAVILDTNVHSCVHTAININRNEGTHTEIIRHSRLDILEDRIKALKDTHDKIWYLIDGVYSMLGDGAPLKDLEVLMNKYEQFYVYTDDAHGTSWIGKNGCGYALNEVPNSDKLYLGMSLAKGFGCQGGIMVYPDRKTKEIVKNVGKTLVFSTPPAPSMSCAILKSAEIHMRPNFADIQLDIKRKIEYFWKKANQLNLPLAGDFKTPIFYIGTGTVENVLRVTKHLMNNGSFVSANSYPSVPIKKTGIRITITHMVTYQDIDNLLEATNEIMTMMEIEGKIDRNKIKKAFTDMKNHEKVIA